MGHVNTIFHQVLSFVRRGQFQNLVDKHDADRYVKNFEAWSRLTTMIFAQAAQKKGQSPKFTPRLTLITTWAQNRQEVNTVRRRRQEAVGAPNRCRVFTFHFDRLLDPTCFMNVLREQQGKNGMTSISRNVKCEDPAPALISSNPALLML